MAELQGRNRWSRAPRGEDCHRQPHPQGRRVVGRRNLAAYHKVVNAFWEDGTCGMKQNEPVHSPVQRGHWRTRGANPQAM